MKMMNQLLLFSLFTSSLHINANENKDLLIPAQPMFGLKDAQVYKSRDNDFYVMHEGKKHNIEKHWNDPLLNKMNNAQLNAFLANGYITLNKMSNNEFKLTAKMRGLGGGPVGATVGAIGGAALVQGAYNGALAGLAAVLTPFLTPVGAGALVGTIRYFTVAPVAVATKTAAIAGGIALGVATGPL